jgi:uncharacterized DUF497 family protein
VNFECDPAKNQRNIATHGISLERAEDMDLQSAFVRQDTRREYPEIRWQAYGLIDGDVYVLVFTRGSEVGRSISLRRANKRERKLYEKQTR